ncbi:MAG: histidine kinase [Chitinophagaceae bacterium]|nr:histidine kinase [Chitinophagaceae bacterium]
MTLLKLYFYFASLLFIQNVFGQEHSYTRYDLNDGLAGSTVYTMAQDKDRFLWFGTETGLSRFDGTHFKNYSTSDGLPDNDILDIYCDKKNRIWMATFKVSIAYIFNGQIHNQFNDSALSNLKLPGNILSFVEDKNGDLGIMGRTFLIVLKRNGEFKYVNLFMIHPEILNISITTKGDKGFVLYTNKGLVSIEDEQAKLIEPFDIKYDHYAYLKITENMLVFRDELYFTKLKLLKEHKEVTIPVLKGNLKLTSVSDSVLSFNTRNGAYFYNPYISDKPVAVYLTERPISYAFKDDEKNIWFCTLGNGVYKLNSEAIRTIVMYENNKRQSGVSAITSAGEDVYCGTSLNSIHKVRFGKEISNKRYFNTFYAGELSPVTDLIVCANGDIILGSGVLLTRLDSKGHLMKSVNTVAIKKIQKLAQSLTVASSGSVVNVSLDDFKVLDTIWRERATTVYVKDSNYFIGTLNGLVRVGINGQFENMGDSFPILKNRISVITEDMYGTLWVGTFGNGVIGLKKGKPIRLISEKEGLSSNICRSIFSSKDFLWVGTNKGLNKIAISKPNLEVVNYFTEDGIPSNNIDAIYIKDSTLFLGTPAGLTYFKESDIATNSICSLRWTDMEMNGELSFPDSEVTYFPAKSWNLRFGYVGISFKSNGDIKYQYRLMGLDSNWQTTTSTFLTYPSLPSGDYELQIIAINKYGVKSNLLKYRFVINKYYWETTWFKALVVLLFFVLLMGFYFLSSRFISKREKEKTRISSLISELEQLALKSQMNPHFIFNSLNSIQQYVMDKDVAGANKFISGFSRLIRQTLDFSSKQKIGLDEELDYLTNYLELEKTRFEGSFDYSIDVDPSISRHGYPLPPLILQPFVENSVRHGVRYRKDNNGHIQIKVSIEQDLIFILFLKIMGLVETNLRI